MYLQPSPIHLVIAHFYIAYHLIPPFYIAMIYLIILYEMIPDSSVVIWHILRYYMMCYHHVSKYLQRLLNILQRC